jgi:small conductance mechanosensitive channel
MIHFLQGIDSIKKIISSADSIKQGLAIKGNRITSYFDKAIDSLVEYTPSVISSIIVLIVGLWVVKRIAIIAEKAMVKKDLEISLRTFLKSLISIGLKIVLIITVAGMMGIGTASFVTILGAAGLAVGLALQGSLSNFAGGVLILIFKPFKVGDSIEAAGQSGEVLEIQIFNTILLTGEHKTVILPNGPLSNGTIINTSRYGDLRIDLELRISNENDLDKVKAIIHSVLENNDKIIKEKEAEIFIGKFSDGLLLLQVKPFCLPGDTSTLSSELYEAIKKAFEKNNVRLAVAK